MDSVPIYLPADPPSRPGVRPTPISPATFVADKKVLQREAIGGMSAPAARLRGTGALGLVWVGALGWGLRRLERDAPPWSVRRPVPRPRLPAPSVTATAVRVLIAPGTGGRPASGYAQPMAGLADHLAHVARDGYTIIEDAIDATLLDGLTDDLARLERELGVTAGRQRLRGHPDAADLQPAGPRPDCASRCRCTPPSCRSSRACSTPGCLVSSLSSIAIGPGETAQPIHADDQLIPLPKPHPPPCATPCGRSPTSPRPTAPPGSSPARTSRDRSPDFGRALRLDPGRDGPRAACSSGTAACGTAAAPTPPTERRVGIAMNYCAGYIRQQENQQLGIPAGAGPDVPAPAAASWSATASTTG